MVWAMEPTKKDASRACRVVMLLRGITNQAREAGEIAADLTYGEMPDEVVASLLLIKPIAKAMAIVADEFDTKLGYVEGLLMSEGMGVHAARARVFSLEDIEREFTDACSSVGGGESFPQDTIERGLARLDELAKERVEG